MTRVTKEARGKIFLTRSMTAVPVSFISFVRPASLNCKEQSNALKSSFQTASISTTSYFLIFSLTAFLEEGIFRKYSVIIILCINYITH
jgi:hypothetical protein